MNTDLRSTLRALPVLSGTAPEFDPAQCPDDPTALFAEWFRAAIQAGVAEPHAMTLSTVGADGHPDARVLILKDVDDAGWHFAVSSASKKGADLSSNPVAALTFYWPQLVRQVRLRGAVIADPPDVTAADFLARSDGARAGVDAKAEPAALGNNESGRRAGGDTRRTRRRSRPGSRRMGVLRRPT
jgi:pyridoxamine 5'-phosphate oxidase